MEIATRSTADRFIVDCIPFTNQSRSFRGEEILCTYDYKQGMLPDDIFKMLCRSGAKYVIYSYDTPIAWISQAGVQFLPEIRYSNTTSQHQFIVRRAWSC